MTVNQPVQPSIVPNSGSNSPLSLTIVGDVGPDFAILASTNLAVWQPMLVTNTLTMPCNWSDPDAASFPTRFYRALMGP